MRTFAILMMLQGHFIYETLDVSYRVDSSMAYSTWKYFRGITAPLFFTVSGFIFTYLLIRNPLSGWQNPRVKKGIRRALYLIFWGYLLRLNIWMLFSGKINSAFWMIDVLHCIGLSILGIVGLYLLFSKLNMKWFPYAMAIAGISIFLLHPLYDRAALDFLPGFLANYFTNLYGSSFTIIPWFGYAAIGGSIGWVFYKYKDYKKLLTWAPAVLMPTGLLLIFLSSPFFLWAGDIFQLSLLPKIAGNNYLFIRLGDVFIFFTVFIGLRSLFTGSIVQRLGARTLTIYIVHFALLYGSWLGIGINMQLKNALNPYEAILGALIFLLVNCVFAYYFDKEKVNQYIRNSVVYQAVFVKLPKVLMTKIKLAGVRQTH
jgi:uncharacterized membrane protein